MRIGTRPLTRSERLLAIVFVVSALAWGVDTGVRTFYVAPRADLERELAEAEAALWRTERLEARAEEIRHAYERLQERDEAPDALVRSRSDILLEIEKLARDRVRLHALQPRPGVLDGRPVLHLSLETSSELKDFGEFLLEAIDGLDGVVTALTLTPDPAGTGEQTIRSRVELDVVYDGS